MNKNSIKFGVICNRQIQNWQLNIIKQLLALNDVECYIIVLKDEKQSRGWKKLKLKSLFWFIYLYILERSFHALQKADLSGGIQNDKKCTIIKDEHTDELINKNLDFIFNFGFESVSEKTLNAAKYGVWSFYNSGNQNSRRGLPGFWEIYDNKRVTGVFLKKITKQNEPDIILKKGYLQTKFSYKENLEQIYAESSRWPVHLCTDIKNGQTEKFLSGSEETKLPVYREPSNIEFLVFVLRSYFNRAKILWKKIFYIDYWNIGVAKAHISSFFDDEKPKVEWFPLKTREKFIADPFALYSSNDTGQNHLHLFFETYPYDENKGRIDYSLYDKGFTSRIDTIIDESFHLSYPYIISHDENIYMVPESYKNDNISIYKAENFPHVWKKKATLIENYKGVDTTIIKHEGTWWLFTSNKADGVHYNLQLFYSNNLFSGWTPHPKNPVKTDIRSARCAGTPFIYNEELIRPSMDYSEKIEGRITLNKIVTLSKVNFEEISIKTIDPYSDTYFCDKIHTLAQAGEFTIIDGCKESFIFSDFTFLKSKVKDIRKALSF